MCICIYMFKSFGVWKSISYRDQGLSLGYCPCPVNSRRTCLKNQVLRYTFWASKSRLCIGVALKSPRQFEGPVNGGPRIGSEIRPPVAGCSLRLLSSLGFRSLGSVLTGVPPIALKSPLFSKLPNLSIMSTLSSFLKGQGLSGGDLEDQQGTV